MTEEQILEANMAKLSGGSGAGPVVPVAADVEPTDHLSRVYCLTDERGRAVVQRFEGPTQEAIMRQVYAYCGKHAIKRMTPVDSGVVSEAQAAGAAGPGNGNGGNGHKQEPAAVAIPWPDSPAPETAEVAPTVAIKPWASLAAALPPLAAGPVARPIARPVEPPKIKTEPPQVPARAVAQKPWWDIAKPGTSEPATGDEEPKSAVVFRVAAPPRIEPPKAEPPRPQSVRMKTKTAQAIQWGPSSCVPVSQVGSVAAGPVGARAAAQGAVAEPSWAAALAVWGHAVRWGMVAAAVWGVGYFALEIINIIF